MTDREELLRVATALLGSRGGSGMTQVYGVAKCTVRYTAHSAIEDAKELLKAIDAEFSAPCAAKLDAVRVKPEPVAWRDPNGDVWPAGNERPGWTPLYVNAQASDHWHDEAERMRVERDNLRKRVRELEESVESYEGHLYERGMRE